MMRKRSRGPFNFKNEEWALKYLPWVRLSSVIAHPAFISDDQLKATSDEEAAELVRHLQATANHLLDLVDTIQLALDRLTELRQQ